MNREEEEGRKERKGRDGRGKRTDDEDESREWRKKTLMSGRGIGAKLGLWYNFWPKAPMSLLRWSQ